MGLVFFFFQAEDGIRDKLVTGVQTCALPIFAPDLRGPGQERAPRRRARGVVRPQHDARQQRRADRRPQRSEEHTSELRSLAYVVCRLLLEKKKYPSKRHSKGSDDVLSVRHIL